MSLTEGGVNIIGVFQMGLLRNVAKTVTKTVEQITDPILDPIPDQPLVSLSAYLDPIFVDTAQVLRDVRHIVDDVLRVLTEPSFSGDLTETLSGLYYDNLGGLSDDLDNDIDQLVENVVDLVDSIAPNLEPVGTIQYGLLFPTTDQVEAIELGHRVVEVLRGAGLDGQPFDGPQVGDGALLIANSVLNFLEGDGDLTSAQLALGVGVTLVGLNNTIQEAFEGLAG